MSRLTPAMVPHLDEVQSGVDSDRQVGISVHPHVSLEMRLWIGVLMLLAVGFVMIYSASSAIALRKFADASYYMWQVEWDFWFSQEAPARAGEFFTEIARQRLTPLQDKMTLLEKEGEVLPGVSVLFAPGHTPGHMVVSFASDGERLLYTGDTVLHPVHLAHPDWVPVFDILPEPAAASKRRIFDLAASTGSWVLGQHFPPFPNLGHVVKKEIGWEWRPK